MKFLIAFAFFVFAAGLASAQTEPAPSDASVYATLVVDVSGTPEYQMTRLDYIATAGQLYISNVLTFFLLSMWGIFLMAGFFFWNKK
jgi:hypothetical protein